MRGPDLTVLEALAFKLRDRLRQGAARPCVVEPSVKSALEMVRVLCGDVHDSIEEQVYSCLS
jgi:hypothetical protein